jgi:lysophospholipid acyltransferase 5
VYKRLKFLGNRYISQAAALTFLAVWHGLHSGYYMCFLLEFVIMKLEKDVSISVLDFKFIWSNGY